MRRLNVSMLLVALGALVTAAPASAQGSISGRVVNSVSGAPIRRAEVVIVVDTRTDLRGTAPTDGDGRYVLRGLPAGRYRIGAEKRGYAPMNYGGVRPYMGGRVIVLAAGEQKQGLDIQLPQLSVITGTVSDVEGGPARAAAVQALRHEFQRGKPVWTQVGWANTDSQGRYRIFHLVPGKYILSSKKFDQPAPMPQEQDGGTSRLTNATTYLPGTLDRQQAKIVVLGPGQTADNLDIALLQSRPIVLDIGGDLPGPAPVAPPEPVASGGEVNLGQPMDDGDAAAAQTQMGPQNQFVQLYLVEKSVTSPAGMQFGGGFPLGSRTIFNDLAPGRYLVSGEATVDERLFAARQEFDLSGGSLSVTLHFAPAIEISGHVRIQGQSASAAGGRVYLVSGDGFNRQGAEARVEPDGSYVLKNVPPGLWDIGVEPIPKGGYLKSMLLGDVDVLRADMYVTAETKGPLEIVVSTDGAHVNGKVEGGQARALLAEPQGDLAGLLSFYTATTVDERGAFELKAMTPGLYRLYAFEDLAYGAWFDPDFLKPYADRGTPIELKPGAKTEITVQAIGPEVAK